MKIGFIVPVGELKKYGYHHNFSIIIKNLTDFGDYVVLISSGKNDFSGIQERYNNLMIISDELSWFKMENEREIFSFNKLNDNVNMGLDILRKKGCDAAIEIHINQYITESGYQNIKEQCKRMVDEKRPYEWLYKRYQCGKLLFNSDISVPWIMNLKMPNNPWRYNVDSIMDETTGERVRIRSGNFRKYNHCAIVDIIGSLTIEEAKAAWDFTIEELRKTNGTYNPYDKSNLLFQESEFLKYHQGKINNKAILKKCLDKTGREILSNRKMDLLSHYFEKNYNPKSKVKRIIGYIISKVK